MRRRAVLASATAAVALGGCGRPAALLAPLGIAPRLEIEIVGMPASQAAQLVDALGACQTAYEEAHRGGVKLHVATSLVPEGTWYSCTPPPHPPGQCPPGAYPASLVKLSASEILIPGAKPAGQIGSSGVPQFLVRGRTRLDVQFGDGALRTPVVSPALQDLPDIILAYDLWQYWLTPLATDLSETWKTLTDDRTGLAADFERYGRFFAHDRGTFVAAFPLLRNPMMVSNVNLVTPWTWPQLISALEKPPAGHPAYAWDTTEFRQSPLYPQPTEWAASMVVASGGRLATSTAESSTAVFASAAAAAGLQSVVDVVAAGPAPATPSDLNVIGARPTYMWNPLGGVRLPFGIEGLPFFPWPAGPLRTALPCMYLCATVVAGRKRVEQAKDFASFLMHPSSQQHLVRWQGGLALRKDQARPQATALLQYLPANFIESLISSANDLTASDLYGGEKTVKNAAAYDRVADRFASALAAAEAAGPNQVKAVLQHAVSG